MGFVERLLGRETSEGVPSWASFFTANEYRTFAVLVEAELRDRGLSYEIGDGTVHLGDDGATLGLVTLAQRCNQSRTAEWPEIVATHVGTMLAADDDAAELRANIDRWETVEPLLRVRLYGDEMDDPERVTWPIAEGLVAALVFDLPATVRSVSNDEAQRWRRSRAELYEKGVANALAEPAPEHQIIELEGGTKVTALLGESFFTTAHALRLGEVARAAPYGLLFAAPHRHAVLVHVIEDVGVVRAINAMILTAHGMFREGPGSVSPNLYWHRGTHVEHVEGRLDETGVRFTPPDDFVDLLSRLAKKRS